MLPVTVTTVYTRERLLRFQRRMLRGKLPMVILLGVCTLIVLACDALLLVLRMPSRQIQLCVILILVIDVLYALLSLLLPRLVLKKAKNVDATVTMTFELDELHYTAQSELVSEQSTMKYRALHHAWLSGDELYLFVNRRSALIASLSTLSPDQISAVCTALEAALTVKRVRRTA